MRSLRVTRVVDLALLAALCVLFLHAFAFDRTDRPDPARRARPSASRAPGPSREAADRAVGRAAREHVYVDDDEQTVPAVLTPQTPLDVHADSGAPVLGIVPIVDQRGPPPGPRLTIELASVLVPTTDSLRVPAGRGPPLS